jgi:hypothetical protein
LPILFSDQQCAELAGLAARTGKLGCLEVLRAWGCPMGRLVWAAAGGGGRVDVLRWLHDVSPRTTGEVVTHSAARAGHLDCVSFLHSIGAP